MHNYRIKRAMLMIATWVLVSFASASSTSDAERGKEVAQVCAACHGADGNSLTTAFPKIAGQHAKYTNKQLLDMKKPQELGGRSVPEMAAILAQMTDQDFLDVAAYYSQQTMTLTAVEANEDLLSLGASLYRSGNSKTGMAACIGCHGPKGKGNPGVSYPKIAGQHADYIEKQLKAFRLGHDQPTHSNARINDGETRIMRDVASRMTDLEIKAVAYYMSSLY